MGYPQHPVVIGEKSTQERLMIGGFPSFYLSSCVEFCFQKIVPVASYGHLLPFIATLRAFSIVICLFSEGWMERRQWKSVTELGRSALNTGALNPFRRYAMRIAGYMQRWRA